MGPINWGWRLLHDLLHIEPPLGPPPPPHYFVLCAWLHAPPPRPPPPSHTCTLLCEGCGLWTLWPSSSHRTACGCLHPILGRATMAVTSPSKHPTCRHARRPALAGLGSPRPRPRLASGGRGTSESQDHPGKKRTQLQRLPPAVAAWMGLGPERLGPRYAAAAERSLSKIYVIGIWPLCTFACRLQLVVARDECSRAWPLCTFACKPGWVGSGCTHRPCRCGRLHDLHLLRAAPSLFGLPPTCVPHTHPCKHDRFHCDRF